MNVYEFNRDTYGKEKNVTFTDMCICWHLISGHNYFFVLLWLDLIIFNLQLFINLEGIFKTTVYKRKITNLFHYGLVWNMRCQVAFLENQLIGIYLSHFKRLIITIHLKLNLYNLCLDFYEEHSKTNLILISF